MVFLVTGRRFLAGAVLGGLMLAVAGCQAGDTLGALKLGGGGGDPQPQPGQVTLSELRAFCPKVALRQDTAFYRTYEGNAQGDPSKVIYQAAITDVTRSCSYGPGTIQMNVALAGRIVPGPSGSTGTIRMPIHIMVVEGSEVVYEQLHNYQVQIADTAGATQFVFNDPNVVLPQPSSNNVMVFVGYEEQPSN